MKRYKKKATLQAVYEYIRKHYPEFLGFVNKKKYRASQAKKKAKKRSKKQMYIYDGTPVCEHKKAILYHHAIENTRYGYCPDCDFDGPV